MFFKKFFIITTLLAIFLSPTVVLGEDKYGTKATADAAGLKTEAAKELPVLIGSVLGTGLSLVGVLFFALMLYGGLTWMLARGNSEQETKALDTITAAIIGIVIVLASYAITNFVFKNIGPGGGGSSVAGSCQRKVDANPCNVKTEDCSALTPFCIVSGGDLCALDSTETDKTCSAEKDLTKCTVISGGGKQMCEWE